jgi:hypothetical protein
MPYNPLYVRSFDKPLISPQEVEGINQKNALGRIDLQNEQLKQQVMSNPDYGMAAQAQAAMGQHQQSTAAGAAKWIADGATAVANSPDPVNAAHSILGSPLFVKAWQTVGGDPNQIEQMRSYVSDPATTRQHAMDLARQFGGNPNAGQTVVPQNSTILDANRQPMYTAPQQPATPFQQASLAETTRHNKATEAAATAKLSGGGIDTSDPVVQSWGQAVLGGNATMQQVPNSHRDSVAMLLSQMPTSAYSPQAASRFSVAANRISSNYVKLPQYELTANGLPYLQRIDAALKTPGSVSDQDLLDSLTKLNTAGNAISDAQVRLITDGKSWSDMLNTAENKFKNGGVLSNNQREQIHTIANAIFDNYKKGYQPVYDQVTKQLKASGIPEPFWGIPDLNKLSDQAQGAAATPRQNANGWILHTDAQGNKAYVSPDGKQYQEVK